MYPVPLGLWLSGGLILPQGNGGPSRRCQGAPVFHLNLPVRVPGRQLFFRATAANYRLHDRSERRMRCLPVSCGSNMTRACWSFDMNTCEGSTT